MTKNILLAATALSAIAMAGAANAQAVSGFSVSGVSRTVYTDATAVASPLTALTAANRYVVASESAAGTDQKRTTVATTFSGIYRGDGLKPAAADSYRLTISLSGAATASFTESLSSGSLTLTGAAACTGATKTLVSGGGRGDSSVTFELTGSAGCAAVAGGTAGIAGFTLTAPFQVSTLGAATVSYSTAVVGAAPTLTDTVLYQSGARSAQFLSTAAAYAFTPAAVNTTPFAAGTNGSGADSRFSLTPSTTGALFSTIQGDAAIGEVGFNVLADRFAGIDGVVAPAPVFTVAVNALTGTFGTGAGALTATATGTADAVNATTRRFADIAAGTTTVSIVPALSTNTASLASVDQQYSATVTPRITTASQAALVTLPAARTYLLETVELDGKSVVAPWMTSTIQGNNTVLRLANGGARAVGAVQLSLSSPQNTTANSAGVCNATNEPTLAGIAVNGELVINSALLTRCFGEFGRADVNVRILDTSTTGVSAKLRIVSAAGVVSEQSLNYASGSAL